MANGLIGKIIRGDRELSSDKADVLIGLFGWIPIKFTHGMPVKNNRTKSIKKLPNLNKDGSFDMNYWEVLAVKMCHKTEPHAVKYDNIDGKYYPR